MFRENELSPRLDQLDFYKRLHRKDLWMGIGFRNDHFQLLFIHTELYLNSHLGIVYYLQ